MTDTVKSWIEERRAIHAAAESPWWTTRDLQPATVFAGDGSAEDIAVLTTFEHIDAAAIVDAHNMFPRALDALGKVLELHSPATVYTWAEECSAPGSHEAITDVRSGDMLCEDEPIGRFCNGCVPENDTTIDVDEYPWPCPTVQAIEGAINE